MNFQRYLGARRRLIERTLQRHVNRAVAPSTLREAMRYSLLAGGKRLRPLWCIAAAEACGGIATRAAGFACAVELVHTYSLIHDDLPAMDDDALRRGRPTSHIVFGDATAILAGDALLTEAFLLIAEQSRVQRLSPSRGLRIVAELAAAAGARGMVAGQADDLAAENRRLSQRQVEAIHRRKTGALITAAVRIGALAAGPTPARLRALTTYAEAAGLAFQIADDLLDDQAAVATGKTRGRDRARHKSTFVTMMGADAAGRRLDQLSKRAIAALRRFDTRADPLRMLARQIVDRTAGVGA